MAKKIVAVKPIEIINGEPVINLSAGEFNSDWIRTARKIKAGESVEDLNGKPMYQEVEIDESK